jgi:hypothetical protein
MSSFLLGKLRVGLPQSLVLPLDLLQPLLLLLGLVHDSSDELDGIGSVD